jgi:enoyl-CoA hydratase
MPHVTFELRNDIAVVVMDDGKANALGYALMDDVEAVVDRAEREARAVVLTGRRGRFCAGFDLAEMMNGAERAQALVTRGADFLLRLYTLPLPLVIACTGHSLAGGALLVLTGDLRVAVRGPFRIGLNEVQIGIPLPILAMELARDRLSPAHLTAAALFAEVVDPERAVAAGWVDELVGEEALLDTALAHARRLAALPRDPYAKTKIALRGPTVRYVRETLAEDMKRLVPTKPPGS